VNIVIEILQNKYIYVPFLVWFAVQAFKVIYELIKNKEFNFKRIVGAGGMISSHSATMATITTLIGKYEGVETPLFAFAIIVSFIVMYDACGVRRAAGNQAKMLNKVSEKAEFADIRSDKKLVENLGHTPMQVVAGAILGFIVGIFA